MMRVVSIVGIRKSGKTSTVTALCEAIRRRGLRVGTCKTVFCPTFSIDKAGTNTFRHRQAGAELVCSRAKHETAFLYPDALPLREVLRRFEGFDWVLLEGDYLADVPRIVAAHTDADALPRTNDRTVCYAGRISQRDDIPLSLPRFNPLEGADELLDFLTARIAPVNPEDIPDTPLPPVPGVTDDGFCQCGCHHHQKKESAGVSVMVDGRALTLADEQRALIRSWATHEAE